jgi:iron(III) transport system permease protein
LAMPGYVAGASIVFIKILDDLGTPLLLNVTKMLAPQAYLRISSIGITDPIGYVISVLLVAFSLGALWVARLATSGREYATVQRGGGGLQKRDLRPGEKVLCYSIVLLILVVVLSPHIGLLLLSFGTVWSYAVLPDAYTVAHYIEIVRATPQFMTNTVLYAGFAAFADIVIGVAIAYLVMRSRLLGREWLDYVAMSAIAIPGLVLGIGYLRSFHGLEVPFTGEPLATWWVLLVVALSIRRLPYALRACTAGLHQVSVSLEEAALNLGARRLKTVRRIVVPLMGGAILAGFVTSFATAAVELSTTIMLVASEANAPLSYGIYIYMQSAAGRGAGAALGIVAVVIVALGTYISHRIIATGARAEEITSA